MKIVVDKMPPRCEECLFALFSCEYGYGCKLLKNNTDRCPLISLDDAIKERKLLEDTQK